MSGKYRAKGCSNGNGLIALAIIAVVALPVVGLKKITSGNDDDKALGKVLLGIGLLIWFAIIIMSN